MFRSNFGFSFNQICNLERKGIENQELMKRVQNWTGTVFFLFHIDL